MDLTRILILINPQVNAYIPDSSSSLLVEIFIVVDPFIHILPITVTPSNKVRLMSSFVQDNPTQLKLNRYNPKIVISKKPLFGKLRKIRRSTGDVENVNDKDVTSFTYKEMKSGIIYYVARKFPSGFSGINDTFEFVLTTKTAQPAQAIVTVEIQSPNRGADDSSHPEIFPTESSFLPFELMCLIAILFGVILFLLCIILIIKCRSGKKVKSDSAKDPPHLPRPPEFITMNRSMYTPSDNESLPVTQSSTPLPVLSNVPHCKVIPIGQLDIQDSDPEDMIDMRDDAREQMLRGYGFSDGPESWTSSMGDMGTIPEVSYSSQHIPPKINPLLRRNQYWV
jgi:chondroitin sulfate proteoglycan 4